MGYAECNVIMDSRAGSVSSGLGYSSGKRGQALKSSPFCPRSSSKLAQSIVKDHMVSHYKKIYSAKAAVDTSVPKSLIHSVKYNDQLRRSGLRKGSRPQSAQSLSQRSSRASCSSAQSRLSVQYDDSPYLCSRSSMVSSPRFGTSFHVKETVYPSYKVRSQSHQARPGSEMKYQSLEVTPQKKHASPCWLGASGDQSYKTFQDPVQKTYGGDLLQKHSQNFTQDKPFTPKTLKSDERSYLSKYRYYRSPRRKPAQESNQSRLTRQETYHGSTKTKEWTQEPYEPSQGFNTEHEWSEDEFNSTYLSASRQHSRANKGRDLFDYSSRVSTGGGKSPTMKSVSAEEEELMYLEFISAVTDDILSRGHISDRIVERVIKRHVEMNRHQLDEGKMHHLLEVLRKDFEAPTKSAELQEKEDGPLDAFLPHLESGGQQVTTKESDDLFAYASLINYCTSPEYPDPTLESTPICSPDRTASPTRTNEKVGEDPERGINSPSLSEHVSNNTGNGEEDFHQNQISTTNDDNEDHEYATVASEEGSRADRAEISNDGQAEELEQLGKSFSESLHVSRSTHDEETTNAVASDSDDEF